MSPPRVFPSPKSTKDKHSSAGGEPQSADSGLHQTRHELRPATDANRTMTTAGSPPLKSSSSITPARVSNPASRHGPPLRSLLSKGKQLPMEQVNVPYEPTEPKARQLKYTDDYDYHYELGERSDDLEPEAHPHAGAAHAQERSVASSRAGALPPVGQSALAADAEPSAIDVSESPAQEPSRRQSARLKGKQPAISSPSASKRPRTKQVLPPESSDLTSLPPSSDEAPESESDSEPRRATRSRKRAPPPRKRARGNAVVATADPVAPNEPAHPPFDELDSAAYPAKGNVARWLEGRDEYRKALKKVVKPAPIDKPLVYVKDIINGPVVDGRRFKSTYKARSKPHSGPSLGTWFSFKNENGPEDFKFRILDEATPSGSKDEASRLAMAVCAILDRLPVTHLSRYTDYKSLAYRAILHAASNVTFPEHAWCPSTYSIRSIRQRTTGSYYRAKGFVLVSGEGDIPNGYSVVVTVGAVDPQAEIPAPPNFLMATYAMPKDLSEDEVPLHQQTIAAVQYICGHLFGAIGTVDAINREIQRISPVREAVREKKGPYNGQLLWAKPTPSLPRDKDILIKFSRTVRNDCGGRENAITIKGRSKTRAAYVLEAMLQTWYSGAGVLNTWQKGCAVADSLNISRSEELDLDFSCTCSDVQRDSQVHICCGCFAITNCSLLRFDDQGRRICARCHAKGAADLVTRSNSVFRKQIDILFGLCDSRAHPHSEMDQLPDLLRRVMFSVTAELGKNHGEGKGFAYLYPDTLALTSHLAKWFNTNYTWQDSYTAVYRPDMAEEQTRGSRWLNPFLASCDAVYPYIVVQGVTTLHTTTNIVVTAQYLNFAKSQYLPGVLGLIGEAQSLRDLDPLAPEWLQLLYRFDHQFALTMLTPKEKRRRLFKTMSVEEYEKLRALWVSGIAPDSVVQAGSSDKLADYYLNSAKSMDWRPEGYSRIERLIDQMERLYGHKIYRSRHNAPWPFIRHHMPDDWTWKWLWSIFICRQTRMRVICNRQHDTIDNVECLVLECLRQWLKNKGRDFFGLEMTIWYRHPCCFAIAHDLHGQQMRTGFITAHPEDFARDYDESLCNILFETQLSNFAKSKYPLDTYPAILADIRNIPKSTQWYTKPTSPVPQITIVRRKAPQTFHYFPHLDEDGSDSGNESADKTFTDTENEMSNDDADNDDADD